jgi:very-short-patch-repair endonuclease
MMDFQGIRTHYARELPRMMAEYADSGRMLFDPYGLDFYAGMTPIESAVWSDIRCEPIPMYPQIPALRYFFDFANPFIKVAIECDGKQWHDPAKDAIRDAKLMADGWTIYRIPGRECNKLMDTPWDIERKMYERGCQDDDEINCEAESQARKWFAETSTGIVHAINVKHFGKKSKYENIALTALDARRS